MSSGGPASDSLANDSPASDLEGIAREVFDSIRLSSTAEESLSPGRSSSALPQSFVHFEAARALEEGAVMSVSEELPASTTELPSSSSLGERSPVLENQAALQQLAEQKEDEQTEEEDLSSQFLCPICLEVCDEAVETPCCHNLFCQHCLLSAEHHIEKCPLCKCKLQTANVVANVPVRRMISDLPCRCRFQGCSAKLRRRERLLHEVQCEFEPLQCPFSEKCGRLLRAEMLRHKTIECEFRPVVCQLGCGSTVPYSCMDEHLRLECPRMTCACEFCKVSVCRADLPEHLTLCPKVVVCCALRDDETQSSCDHQCQRQHLQDHQQVCSFRMMKCKHDGCNRMITARRLSVHEENCESRLIPCHKCNFDVCSGMLQQHFDADCPEHVIACPFSIHGCSEMFPRRLLQDHLQQRTESHLTQLCSALAARDDEIKLLKIEALQMRADFGQRLECLESVVMARTSPTQALVTGSPVTRVANLGGTLPASPTDSPPYSASGGEQLRAQLRHPGVTTPAEFASDAYPRVAMRLHEGSMPIHSTGVDVSIHQRMSFTHSLASERGAVMTESPHSPWPHQSLQEGPHEELMRQSTLTVQHSSSVPARRHEPLEAVGPPAAATPWTRESLGQLAGDGDHLEQPPRTSDMLPGPAWDRDLVVSPPGALQPLMLLRDASQVPFFRVPPSSSSADAGSSWQRAPHARMPASHHVNVLGMSSQMGPVSRSHATMNGGGLQPMLGPNGAHSLSPQALNEHMMQGAEPSPVPLPPRTNSSSMPVMLRDSGSVATY
eukprot:TRINITY_DN24575_c0_g1_i1.p1 TRINITY_DN24575_c0_g1~~TRINITY_DN24575_c0_g1_i1.p1  ORF type:complete len:791 (-),score=106.13 TRINITY_DN24575_c0_g1_i1:141-2480(-)